MNRDVAVLLPALNEVGSVKGPGRLPQKQVRKSYARNHADTVMLALLAYRTLFPILLELWCLLIVMEPLIRWSCLT